MRWFAFDGPDTLNNGLALCVLHHKLFDLGVIGLTVELRLQVSSTYTARTPVGRAVYDLRDHPCSQPAQELFPHQVSVVACRRPCSPEARRERGKSRALTR